MYILPWARPGFYSGGLLGWGLERSTYAPPQYIGRYGGFAARKLSEI